MIVTSPTARHQMPKLAVVETWRAWKRRRNDKKVMESATNIFA